MLRRNIARAVAENQPCVAVGRSVRNMECCLHSRGARCPVVGTKRTCRPYRLMSAFGGRSDMPFKRSNFRQMTLGQDPNRTSVGFNAARTPGGSLPQRRSITAEMWRCRANSPISFPFSAQLRARFVSTIAASALSAAERSVASGGASVAYRIVLSAQAAPHACCCRHRWPRGADARNECGRRLA